MKCRKKITRNQRILSLGVGSLTRASISIHSQKTVRAMPIIQNMSTIESKPANGPAAPPSCANSTTDDMAPPLQEKRSLLGRGANGVPQGTWSSRRGVLGCTNRYWRREGEAPAEPARQEPRLPAPAIPLQ